MIKGSIQQEDITIVNTYTPNIGAPKYIKQILTNIKGEIDSNTIIVGNFNTQTENQKENTGLETHIRPDGLNRYRILHPKSRRIHILSTCTWNILQAR